MSKKRAQKVAGAEPGRLNGGVAIRVYALRSTQLEVQMAAREATTHGPAGIPHEADAPAAVEAFERYLAAHPGAIASAPPVVSRPWPPGSALFLEGFGAVQAPAAARSTWSGSRRVTGL
jgi:hypothetical protein